MHDDNLEAMYNFALKELEELNKEITLIINDKYSFWGPKSWMELHKSNTSIIDSNYSDLYPSKIFPHTDQFKSDYERKHQHKTIKLPDEPSNNHQNNIKNKTIQDVEIINAKELDYIYIDI